MFFSVSVCIYTIVYVYIYIIIYQDICVSNVSSPRLQIEWPDMLACTSRIICVAQLVVL